MSLHDQLLSIVGGKRLWGVEVEFKEEFPRDFLGVGCD